MTELSKKQERLKELLRVHPDILAKKNLSKKERIRQLQKLIEEDRYELDAGAIAEKMLEKLL